MNRIILLMMLISCSPTSPDDIYSFPSEWKDVIQSNFTEAQEKLICLGYEKASDVDIYDFRWIPESRRVRCGGSGYHSGCFGTSGMGVIQFYTEHAFVLRHEAGHAILWKINARPLWKCFEHPEKSWCPKKLREIDWEENCADKN